MKTRQALVLFAAFALSAICAGYWLVRRDPASQATSKSVAQSETVAAVQRSHPPARTANADPAQAGTAPAGESIRGRFDRAGNYLEYARSILADAQEGNPDAQYYLSEALRYCAVGYRTYFDRRGGTRRTLDEAVQRAATLPALDADEARRVHDRCQDLKSGDESFGTADEWLEASAAAGQPLAQVSLAIDHALQAKLMFADERAGAGTRDGDESALRRSSLQLFDQAIRSKDPEVIWKAGDLMAAMSENWQDGNREQWVWKVAACQRGLDCGSGAEWYQFGCRFDVQCQPGESGLDYIRRATENEYDGIVEDARKLNAEIDSGRWSQLAGGRGTAPANS